MALIKCPDCEADVSDAAPACPKCGRPIAEQVRETDDLGMPLARIKRPRSSTRVTITLSSFVLVAAAVFAAIWFVPALELGQHVEASCQVNGFGDGSCQFTNTGWTPGSQCVVVRLVNKQGEADSSGPVCSGRIWPNDTADRHVSVLLDSKCEALGGLLPVVSRDVCSMDIRNVDDDDADAAFQSSPATQSGTASSASPSTTAASASDDGASPDTSLSGASDGSQSSADMSAADDAPKTVADAAAPIQAASTASNGAPAPASTGVETAPPSSALATGNSSPVLQALIAKTNGPSFDCSTVTNPTAVAICDNAELSQLDRQMAILYYESNYATDANTRAQQRQWIKQRNDACGVGVDCLRTQFNDRIRQLQQAESARASPPSETSLQDRMASIRNMSEAQFDGQFRCPETYSTDDEGKQGVGESVAWLGAHREEVTPASIAAFRLNLLTEHNCVQTLRNIHHAARAAGQAVPPASN